MRLTVRDSIPDGGLREDLGGVGVDQERDPCLTPPEEYYNSEYERQGYQPTYYPLQQRLLFYVEHREVERLKKGCRLKSNLCGIYTKK